MSAHSVAHRIAPLLAALVIACSKKDGADVSGKAGATGAVIETFGTASIAWTVDADGRIRAEVKDPTGTEISKDVSGTVEWQTETGEPRSAKLAYDGSAKALVAVGPAPTRDITTLTYRVATKGEPLSGTLHVPVGGTSAFAAGIATDAAAPDAKGPHGGVVQVVGDDRVEIVSDEGTDDVRVYVLGEDGKAVAPGDRKVTLAVVAERSEVIVLRPSDDGAYLVGRWTVKDDPSRITVVVRRSNRVAVAIVGWAPGARLVVAGGPPSRVKVHVKGNGARVDIKIKDGPGAPTMLKVDLKEKGGGHGKHK